MFERLMTDQRKLVVGVLIALFSVTLLLWLIRGPQPFWSNIPFLALSLVLTPLAYFGTHGILYLSVMVNHVSSRAIRGACGFFFVGAVSFLAASAFCAVVRFVSHRPLPPANFLALGVALGAMKAWTLQVTTMES